MSAYRFMQLAAMLMLVVSGLFSGPTHGQSNRTPLIPEVTILRGEFEQIRTLKGFRNPLKSEGRFLVSKANGVIWQSLKPFPSQIRISNSGKIVNLSNKSIDQKANNKKPNAGMNKIMLAVLSGNQAEMAKYFKIERTESNGVWTLQLQPKGGMARVFAHIEIKGDRHIKQVLMQEKSGDQTELHFSSLSEVPNTLTPEEKKYFE
jgi:hypothetical protein